MMNAAVLLASVALMSASVAGAAPERTISEAEANAFADAVTQDSNASAEAEAPAGGCRKMRDGRCPPVIIDQGGFTVFPGQAPKKVGARSNRGAKASDGKQYARPRELPINFVVGSAQLTETSKRNLNLIAARFNRASNALTKFFVDGHTDRSGTCETNLKLSQERAASAVDYLASAGIDRGRMTPRGFGYSALKVPANPSSGANRRVEVDTRKSVA